jgi:hypothetical protein
VENPRAHRGLLQLDSVRQFDEPIEVMSKIRYNHPGTAATVTPLGVAGQK